MLQTQQLGQTVGYQASEDYSSAAEWLMSDEGKPLNWYPMLVQAAMQTEDEQFHLVESDRYVVRHDTLQPLGGGTVKSTYANVSALDAFSIADSIIAAGGRIIRGFQYQGGSLQGIQIEMPIDAREVINGDPVKPYLLIVIGHGGASSIRFKRTAIRVVCYNTLMAALREKTNQQGTIRHSGDAAAKCKIAQRLLAEHETYFEESMLKYSAMYRRTVASAEVESYFSRVAKVETQHKKFDPVTRETSIIGTPGKMLNRYMEAFENDRVPGSSQSRGTVWGLYNAVTFVQDHIMTDLKNKDTKRSSATDNAQYQYFKSAPEIAQSAFDLGMDLVDGKSISSVALN